MKVGKEALKELGKFFYNLALAVAVALIIQPFANDKVNPSILIVGLLSAVINLGIGFLLLSFSDKLDRNGGGRR
ncbi:hypothetical protein [Aquifex sp.]